jgi:hypothetical protein
MNPVAADLTGGVIFAVWAVVIWLAARLPLPRRHAPPAGSHDELPGRAVRPLHDLDRRLLGYIGGAWEELELAGVADRGQAIADLGRSRSDAPDSVLSGDLFRTAHVLETILTHAGDPEGHYWPVILELGAACRDLTELDHTDGGVKP